MNPRAETDEALARLLRSAEQDPVLRGQVLALVRAPAVQRRSLLNAALDEMTRAGEPAAVRAAFALLGTDGGAAAARDYLAG
jgi:hypothetical protein